jgi:signal transduction histidine kinase
MSLTLQFKLEGFLPNYVILFQVQDTGIGIPEQQQKYVFEAFIQGDNSTASKYERLSASQRITSGNTRCRIYPTSNPTQLSNLFSI